MLPDPFDGVACARFQAPFGRPLRSTNDEVNQDDEEHEELGFDIDDEGLYMDDHAAVTPHIADTDEMDVDTDEHSNSVLDPTAEDEWSDEEDVSQSLEQVQSAFVAAPAEDSSVDKVVNASDRRDRNKRKLVCILSLFEVQSLMSERPRDRSLKIHCRNVSFWTSKACVLRVADGGIIARSRLQIILPSSPSLLVCPFLMTQYLPANHIYYCRCIARR